VIEKGSRTCLTDFVMKYGMGDIPQPAKPKEQLALLYG
jgi:hypothetical protein